MKNISNSAFICAILAMCMLSCFDTPRSNNNDPKSSSYGVSAVITPENNYVIESTMIANQKIVITFSESMQTDSVTITGDVVTANLAAASSWSATSYENDTLTISLAGKKILVNNTGTNTLLINGTDKYGKTMPETTITYTMSYPVNVSGIYPVSTSTIAAHEPIVIKFNDTMDTSSVTVTANLVATTSTMPYKLTWSATSKTNDTLTISSSGTTQTTVQSIWSATGAQTLTVKGTTAYGYDVASVTANYTVGNIVYVRTDGDDGNLGTRDKPVANIAKAISLASSVYGSSASSVYVAAGTYYTNWANSTNRIVMVAGISLYGGYSATDWNITRSATTYPTVITDQSSTGGTTIADANRAVDFSSSAISNATILDGFTITGGGSQTNGYSSAVAVYNGAAPTIQNNTINGGSAQTGVTCGIVDKSSPIIQNNVITGGKGNVSAASALGYSYGIYCPKTTGITCSPTITLNTIDGGSGYYSYGVYLNADTVNAFSNKISGGGGNQNSYALFTYSTTSLLVFNNLIFGGQGNVYSYGIYCWLSSPKIYNNTIDGGRSNSSSPSGLYGIYIKDAASSPQIMNNIIFITDYSTSSSYRYGIYEGNAITTITATNNDIYSCSGALYFDGSSATTGAPVSTVSGINGLGSNYSGNISLAPVFAGYSNTTLWSSADLHLASSTDASILTGGLDGSALSWGFSINKDGTTRTGNGTIGWSMGAY